jgi:hypothetical protein
MGRWVCSVLVSLTCSLWVAEGVVVAPSVEVVALEDI